MEKLTHKRPAWLDDGIVMAGEWHNVPRMVRNVGGSVQWVQAYQTKFTEESVKLMKERGINLLIGPYYFGFGADYEREDMELAVELSALCHRYGLRFGAYVQSTGSLMGETFFEEVPEARDWLSIDQDGKYPRYGTADWRFIPCTTCEPYLAYLEEKVLRPAALEVKADLVHFDNFRWWGEPEACRCDRCARRFRQYLEQAWPDEYERYCHFGLRRFDHVQPPIFHFTQMPWQLDVVRDPMMQAWQDFKVHTLGKIYERFAEFLRGLNPEIAVECNVTPPLGANPAINRGHWHPLTYPHGDIFWTEEHDYPGLDKQGRLSTAIRTYKTGQATGNAVFNYTTRGSQPRLTLAEAMAFNRNCLGMVGGLPGAGEGEWLQRQIHFYHDHQDLFRGSESAAEVAVLNSYPSLCYNCVDTHRALVLAEQCLLQARIPFDTLFDNQLDRLSNYRLLILPDCESMSDEQLIAIREFVAAGGAIVATGRTSEFTEFHVPRLDGTDINDIRAGLSDVYEGQHIGKLQSERLRCRHGKGRAAYLPKLVPALVPDKPFEPDVWWRAQSFNQAYWALPTNADDFLELVGWALPEPGLLVESSDTVLVEWARQESRQLVHLLQYDDGRTDVTAKVTLATAKPDAHVSLYSPDWEEKRTVKVKREGQTLSFEVRDLDVYVIACID